MKIAISNRQRLRKLDRSRLRRLTSLLLAEALGPSEAAAWGELSLAFTDDTGIRRVNNDFLGHSDVTDVIAFAYDAIPGENNARSGELVVNVERAVACADKQAGRARSRGARESRELALYLAHGCDHLSGEDDRDSRGRARMRRREGRWLAKADGLGLTAGLLTPAGA